MTPIEIVYDIATWVLISTIALLAVFSFAAVIISTIDDIRYQSPRKGPERPFSAPLPKGMKDRTEKKGKGKKK